MGRGLPSKGLLGWKGGAHIPSIPGALSVQGSPDEHASPQKGDSGLWLWGLSQPGRTLKQGVGEGAGSPTPSQGAGKLGGPQASLCGGAVGGLYLLCLGACMWEVGLGVYLCPSWSICVSVSVSINIFV